MENKFTPNGDAQSVTLQEDTLRQAKSHFSKLGLMFILGTLLVYAVQFAASGIATAINPELLNSTGSTLLITMIPMYAVALPLMMLLIRRLPAVPIGKKRITVGQWIIAAIICYGGMYVGNLLGIITTQIVGMLKGCPVSNAMLEVATSSQLWINFILMVLCAPVFEELIFRKLLIDRTVKYGEGLAVLFSGLMFGLFHGNINQFSYAFILGLFFGFIYVKTGNVLYPIFLHMFINFFGSVLGVLVMNFIDYNSLMEAVSDPGLMTAYMADHLPQLMIYGVYTLLIFGMAVAGIILFLVKMKKIKLLPGEVTIPKKKRFSTTVLNVGMGAYFLFWIAIILIQLFS